MPPRPKTQIPALPLLAALAVFAAQHAAAQFTVAGGGGADGVEVELVSEQATIAPGETFSVALSIQHSGGWHTYYKYPGVGSPWKMAWELPDGFTAGEFHWPVPHVTPMSGLVTYAYEEDTLLITDITAPDSLEPGTTVTLGGTARWLQCLESCIPKSKPLSLTLQVGDGAASDPSQAGRFEEARGRLPATTDAWAFSATANDFGNTIELKLRAAADAANPPAQGDVYFFPDAGGQVVDEAEQALSEGPGDGVFILTLNRPENAEPLETLDGIVAHRGGWTNSGTPLAVPVSLSLDGTEVGGPAAAATGGGDGAGDGSDGATGEDDPFAISGDTQAQIDEIRSWGVVGLDGQVAQERNLAGMLLFAFLGGIILNIMPCVFPVLGIKIMGFVNQAGSSKAHVRLHGLVYAAGVILSLWALVGVLLAVKAALGTNVGWGFQLQNPYFLAFLITLLFVFALSLSGVFEIGTSLTAVGGGLQAKSGYSGSFFSGLLTVLVATPCTGPFMAPAISFALSGSALDTYLVFTALAVGIAVPYVLLSFFPALVKRLPRPGPWMETFKQFMAFPLYATVVWLVGVFGKNVGVQGLTWLLAGLVALAMGAWVYGRYSTPVRAARTRWFGRFAAAASLGLLVMTAGYAIGTKPARPALAAGETIERFGMQWEPFSLERIIDHRAQGRTVFVDFTADW